VHRGRWTPIIAVVAALTILVPALPTPVSAVEPGPAGRPNPGRLLVFTDGGPGARAAVQQEAQRQGGRIADEVRVRPDLGLLAVQTRGAPAALAGLPGVREVVPDLPPIPMAQTQDWGVTRIGAPSVWSGGATVANVVVAVVDGGVDLGHPDLEANVGGQPHANCSGDADCATGGTNGRDGDNDGHGTGVAGIVAAANNDAGTVGVSPSARILAINCFEPGTFFSCLRGVYYAAGRDQNGVKVAPPRAQVVNMSWGWNDRDLNRCASCKTTIQTVMANTWSDGLVLVAAAGNAGNRRGTGDNVIWPARTGIPIAVAATDSANQRASWSSTGAQVDLAAPGVSIHSPYGNGAYATWNGTSAASPHVAGTAALVLSAVSASNTQVREVLLSTACNLGATGVDAQYGNGLARADRAVAAAKGSSPPPC